MARSASDGPDIGIARSALLAALKESASYARIGGPATVPTHSQRFVRVDRVALRRTAYRLKRTAVVQVRAVGSRLRAPTLPGASAGPKVFGVGLSKTGTTSLCSALGQLGFRAGTFRDVEQLGLDRWWAGDFGPDYLQGFDAVTDLPIAPMFEELDARYPGSKFVLTERSTDPWLESIRAQFERSASTNRFHERCRVAAYGYTVFHREAFRRASQAHADRVRSYFADRPDDLLVMNVFEGDGWEELCGFLGLELPSEPFPHVKPGAGAASSWRALTVRSTVAQAQPDAVALVPLVSPEAAHVNDYAAITELLRTTCTSISSQRDASLRAVVVGHRRPDWIDAAPGDVLFIDAGQSVELTRRWGIDVEAGVRLEKAVKMLLGLLATPCGADGPGFALTVDADDLLHIDLVASLRQMLRDDPSAAGARWSSGVEVTLHELKTGGAQYGRAARVHGFDEVCGTSRAFRSSRLRDELAPAAAPFEGVGERLRSECAGASYVRLSAATIDELDRTLRSLSPHQRDLLTRFGAHVDDIMAVPRVGLLGAAKTCEHGQHIGRRGGAVHADRIDDELDLPVVLQTFGLLPPTDGVLPIVGPTSAARRAPLERA